MNEITTTIPAATYAVHAGMPASGASAVAGQVARPVVSLPSAGGLCVRERALAPTTVVTKGAVRLDDDATGFAGTTAWGPPT